MYCTPENTKIVFSVCVKILLALVIANVAGIAAGMLWGAGLATNIGLAFNFDQERSIPTFYGAMILLVSCTLLMRITRAAKSCGLPYFSWLALSLIFLFLTFDEVLQIHERLTIPTRLALQTSGLFYYAWVLPYGLALVAIGFGLRKFLSALPTKIALRFVGAGTIYVAGAIGFEMLGGRHFQLYQDSLGYQVYYTIEESLELLGITLFIYALMQYIALHHPEIRVMPPLQQRAD